MNDQTFLHQHTVNLTGLLKANEELKTLMKYHSIDTKDTIPSEKELKKEAKKNTRIVDVISKWLEIQDIINCFYDSTKALKR